MHGDQRKLLRPHAASPGGVSVGLAGRLPAARVISRQALFDEVAQFGPFQQGLGDPGIPVAQRDDSHPGSPKIPPTRSHVGMQVKFAHRADDALGGLDEGRPSGR